MKIRKKSKFEVLEIWGQVRSTTLYLFSLTKTNYYAPGPRGRVCHNTECIGQYTFYVCVLTYTFHVDEHLVKPSPLGFLPPSYVYILYIRSTYLSFFPSPFSSPYVYVFPKISLSSFFRKNFPKIFSFEFFRKFFLPLYSPENFPSLVFLLHINIIYTYYVYVYYLPAHVQGFQLTLKTVAASLLNSLKKWEKLFTAFPYIYYIYNFYPYIFNVIFLKSFQKFLKTLILGEIFGFNSFPVLRRWRRSHKSFSIQESESSMSTTISLISTIRSFNFPSSIFMSLIPSA